METTSENITYYRIAQILFLIGVFLKQFYLLPSGSFQLGDIFFVFSFLFSIVGRFQAVFQLCHNNKLIILFILCVIIINCVYIFIYGFEYYGGVYFHLSIMYYLYNLLIILTFSQFVEDRRFLKELGVVLKGGLIFQLFAFLSKIGRYYGIIRYMGTFNDPNQCGFFLMMSFFLIFIISIINKERFSWIWFLICFYLTMKTSSTGMVLGLATFIAIFVFFKISDRNMKSAIFFLAFFGVLMVAIILIGTNMIQLPPSITESFMYTRIMEKFFKFGIGEESGATNTFKELMLDRCWDKIFLYPEKALYGAGEGYFGRFPVDSWPDNEIHSSVLGPLFYYGVIPCGLWFLWIANKLKGIKRELWCVYIALFIESLTLVNNRQPFFWMVFVLAGSSLVKKEIDSKTEEIYDLQNVEGFAL